jgi:hypothetical protein
VIRTTHAFDVFGNQVGSVDLGQLSRDHGDCGGSNTAGTLAVAQYTQAFGYDVLGRLVTGMLGSYGYGDPGHVHAGDGIGTQYTAASLTCHSDEGAGTVP